MARLILKRTSVSRPSWGWNDDDDDVLSDGKVVGRIMKAAASPRRGAMDVDGRARPTTKTVAPTHGCDADRAAAMKAFATSWRGE